MARMCKNASKLKSAYVFYLTGDHPASWLKEPVKHIYHCPKRCL